MVPETGQANGSGLTPRQASILKWPDIGLVWLAASAPLWIMLALICLNR